MTAHGICQYEDGTIEWDYSTGGHWTRSELEIVEQFAKKQGNGNFACPRCGRMAMDKNPARNALSRRATVYVCDRCGMAEALEDMLGNIRIALMDWALVQHPEFWNMDN